MIFTELRFLAFLGLVLAVHWGLSGARARKSWLLLVSYAFYAAWDWRFLSLILLSTTVDYIAGRGLAATDRTRTRRSWLALSLTVNLGLLFTFKYLGFFVDSAAELLRWLGFQASLPVISLLLPVGISFYTFQTLSYTLDIYFGRLEARRSFLDFALFVAFFPQLVAGPIVRAREFLPQLEVPRQFPRGQLRALVLLFLCGFFKKACVGDNVAPLIDAYYADPGSYGLLATWQAVLYFFVQMYCDFSGYTDMAIASAGFLGYTLPLNFDFPLLSQNVQQFWRRWHISLFAWFRDYLYIPLGGNRGTPLRTTFNLMVTTTLVGLWHGAAWHYVVWGASVGGMVIGYRFIAPRSPLKHLPGPAAAFLGVVATYVTVSLSVVFFRAVDLPQAFEVFGAALAGRGLGAGSFGAGPTLLFIALALVHWCFQLGLPQRWSERAPSWAWSGALGIALAVTFAFTNSMVVPFEYFQF